SLGIAASLLRAASIKSAIIRSTPDQPRRLFCSGTADTKPYTEGGTIQSRCATVFRGEAAIANDCSKRSP
ncbi:hypothetical protein IG631_24272, partial [Alternaria alternata]